VPAKLHGSQTDVESNKGISYSVGVTNVEDLTLGSSMLLVRVSSFVHAGELNLCPPDQESDALTKELASRVPVSVNNRGKFFTHSSELLFCNVYIYMYSCVSP
jgi:hypothetical protein